MRMWWAIGLALLAAGCATPARQDVEFLRGCWMVPGDEASGSHVSAMLRLLPEGGDGPDYRGVINQVNADGTFAPGVRLSFARDGRWLEIDQRRLPASRPPEREIQEITDSELIWAAWKLPEQRWLIAAGDPQSLVILSTKGDGNAGDVLFQGARDGCD
jgi:hypothetical protein